MCGRYDFPQCCIKCCSPDFGHTLSWMIEFPLVVHNKDINLCNQNRGLYRRAERTTLIYVGAFIWFSLFRCFDPLIYIQTGSSIADILTFTFWCYGCFCFSLAMLDGRAWGIMFSFFPIGACDIQTTTQLQQHEPTFTSISKTLV